MKALYGLREVAVRQAGGPEGPGRTSYCTSWMGKEHGTPQLRAIDAHILREGPIAVAAEMPRA